MYSSPGQKNNNRASPSPRKVQEIQQGPVKEFIALINESRPDDWQRRTNGVFRLVESIPTGINYSSSPELWYNSPPTLRHLANPFSEMLRDPRSTVVKRTCEGISKLLAICQSSARYLFKDMMPTVLAVHAQTVLVIRNYVQTMIEDAIPIVPCKMAMPLWLERLKVEKSRTVRDACVLYLGLGLQHWNDPGYLTDDNLIQVGTALIKTLRDPSPSVRKHAREGLEHMRTMYPTLWDKLARDPDGPAAKDPRLQAWLLKATDESNANADMAEDYSVASRYSNFTMSTNVQRPRPATPSRHSYHGQSSSTPFQRRGSNTPSHIPTSIHVNTSYTNSATSRGGPGGPVGPGGPRRTTPRSGLGPPQRRTTPTATGNMIPPSSPSWRGRSAGMGAASAAAAAATTTSTPPRPPALVVKDKSTEDDDSMVAIKTPGSSKDELDSSFTPSKQPSGTQAGDNNNNEVSPLHLPTLTAGGSDARSSNLPPPNSSPIPTMTITNGETTTTSSSFPKPKATQPPPPPPPPPPPQQKRGRPPTPEDFTPRTTDKDDSQEDDNSNPFLHSMNELKEHAEKSKNGQVGNNNSDILRRSSMLKERMRTSLLGGSSARPLISPTIPTTGSGLSNTSEVTGGEGDHPTNGSRGVVGVGGGGAGEEETTTISTTTSTKPTTPDNGTMVNNINALSPITQDEEDQNEVTLEHITIAQQLLKAHKDHVDTIMETLKTEMDALRNFETSFSDQSIPSEEQVLNYFDSVGSCLDKRTAAGNLLLNEMDRISQGG